jgi:PIN domain nuclease of toxin-antitoxin system
LLWAAKGTLPSTTKSILEDTANDLYFSAVNLWEIELKRSRLKVDSKVLYQNMLHNGYRELSITARHVFELSRLANFHSDPFDRILLAQAMSEQLFLLTADETIKRYADQIDCILSFDQE